MGRLGLQTTATGADVPGAITAYSAISNANPSTTMLTSVVARKLATPYKIGGLALTATEAYTVAYGASQAPTGNFAIVAIGPTLIFSSSWQVASYRYD